MLRKIDFFLIIYLLLFNCPIGLSADSKKPLLAPTLKLEKVDGYLVPWQNGIPLPSFTNQDRPRIDLSGIWKKKRFAAEHDLSLSARTPKTIKFLQEKAQGAYLVDFDDSSWQEHLVPGPENISPDRYQDGVWYRKEFVVPLEYKEELIKLVFAGANYITDVWINGKWLGYHEGGYTPFCFDTSSYVKFDEKNVIAVRIDNIPWLPHKEDEPLTYDNQKLIVPYKTVDWWNYGGITRDVYLEIAPKISVVRTQIKSIVSVNSDKAEIYIGAIIYSNSWQEKQVKITAELLPVKITPDNICDFKLQSLIAAEQKLIYKGKTEKSITLSSENRVKVVEFKLKLKDPLLWSPEDPNIYLCKISVVEDSSSSIDDTFYTQFGIREIKKAEKAARIFLNNKLLYLNGVARHAHFVNSNGEYPVVKELYNDLLLIKELNANFVRTGHYPNREEVYLLADRLGLAVWEEIPVCWFNEEGFDIQEKRGIAKQMWLEMIYRDINHPSILFWGTCNECGSQEERMKYIKEMHRLADSIDGTRLVGQSAVGDDPLDKTHMACDVVGVTMYYGVFYGKKYYEDTLKALEALHAAFPTKPIIITEYGTWSNVDQSLVTEQIILAKESLKAFYEKPYVCGVVWWAMFDWFSHITGPQTMGTVWRNRDNFKPVYYCLQNLYGAKIGDLEITILEPEEYGRLRGKVKVVNQIKSSQLLESVVFTVDGEKQELDEANGFSWDTIKFAEGIHQLSLKVKTIAGQTLVVFKDVYIDNIDNAPELEVNLKDNDHLMRNQKIVITTKDDRAAPNNIKVQVQIEGEARELIYQPPMEYLYDWDLKDYGDGTIHKVLIVAADDKGNETKQEIAVEIDNNPGMYLSLPYNNDWISWNNNRSDGAGWDFPAEELPESNQDFIYNGKDIVKFMFADKADGKMNILECEGQKVEIKPDHYTAVFILASAHNGNSSGEFTLVYVDDAEEKIITTFSDWWGAVASADDELVIKTTHNHQRNNRDNKPGVGVYMNSISVDKTKRLKAIILPEKSNLRIFAITLKKA